MTILDNDLANVIQAERRVEAAHERLIRDLVSAPRNPSQSVSASRVGAAWLRAWMAGRLRVFTVRWRRDPASLETL